MRVRSYLSAIMADGDFNCPPWLDRLTLGGSVTGAAAGGLAFGEDNRAIATIGRVTVPVPFSPVAISPRSRRWGSTVTTRLSEEGLSVLIFGSSSCQKMELG